jgi:hypothetical protein
MTNLVQKNEKICDFIERLYRGRLTEKEMLELIIRYEEELFDV